MQRYKIIHRTYYNFSASVRLEPHRLMLRPRQGPELHIEKSSLEISPRASLRWFRDVEDNSVAIATFEESSNQLGIESESIIQQFNQSPLDFLVSDYAIHYPFSYLQEDMEILAPYLKLKQHADDHLLKNLISSVWNAGEQIQTYTLLERLCSTIQTRLAYQLREEPGVQSPTLTLSLGSGSCRDSAYLFMEISRRMGLASRFVSGYLFAQPSDVNFGSTHAWAEVFLPGAGWKGFDPTIGKIVGSDHFAVAVSRLPESVPPVSGSFVGPSGASLDVGVWVSKED
jgi:transglutaminase-like putative cysteine protease